MLQAELKKLKEEKAQQSKHLDEVTLLSDFLNMQTIIYRKLVRDLQNKQGLILPHNTKETLEYLKTCRFEEFDRDHYTEAELACCNELLRTYQGMMTDSYLLHELYRMYSIYELRYKFASNKVGKAVFSIDKLPGKFE